MIASWPSSSTPTKMILLVEISGSFDDSVCRRSVLGPFLLTFRCIWPPLQTTSLQPGLLARRHLDLGCSRDGSPQRVVLVKTRNTLWPTGHVFWSQKTLPLSLPFSLVNMSPNVSYSLNLRRFCEMMMPPVSKSQEDQINIYIWNIYTQYISIHCVIIHYNLFIKHYHLG